MKFFAFFKNPKSSLREVIHQLFETISRFPLPVLFSVIGTIVAIQLINLDFHTSVTPIYEKIIYCCSLGLVYGTAVNIFAETQPQKRLLLIILNLILIALLVLYFFSIVDYPRESKFNQFALIVTIGHLLVAVVPFYKRGAENNFWHYNKTLFLRILTAILYSGVLFAGIAIALFAIHILFEVEISTDFYFDIWWIIIGVFNTCFFLSGIPINPEQMDMKEQKYPKGLKFFAQFILIPLVSLYVVILLAYELKIIILWKLSEGWVSNLVIAFGIVGILSLLLVDPLKKSTENKWIKLYTKIFYIIILPIVALLFVAIFVRIDIFGFTEQRFWVLIMGIWLLFIALYFIFSKKKNIKIVPLTLILAGIISIILAPALTINSQRNKIKNALLKNHLLKNGIFIKATKDIPDSDNLQITTSLDFLYNNYGSNAIQPFFTKKIIDKSGRYSYASDVIDSLMKVKGLNAIYYLDIQPTGTESLYLNVKDNYKINTKGYEYLLRDDDSQQQQWHLGDTTLNISLSKNNKAVIFSVDSQQVMKVEIDTFINTFINQYKGNNYADYNPDSANFVAENNKIKVKIFLGRLSGEIVKGKEKNYKDLDFNFFYLVKFKQPFLHIPTSIILQKHR